MKSIKDIIADVLDNNESLCLDSSEDKGTLLDSIMDALALDNDTIIQMLEQTGVDIQRDNDGQIIVYTNVYGDSK